MTTGNPTSAAASRALMPALARARALRRYVLDGRSNAAIIDAIACTAADWTQDRGGSLSRTAADLEARLGLSADMVRVGLSYTFAALAHDALERVVAEQAEDPRALEAPVTNAQGARRRLGGPPVVLHALAGNVPGLAIPAVCVSLLARSVAVVRDSARQPLLTERFVASLAARAPELAGMIVPVAWSSDAARPPVELTRTAQRVELYGADETIERLTPRFAGAEVVAHATRVSAALVPGDAFNADDEDRTASWIAPLAEDVAIYDGLGCLSPAVVIVEGEVARARRVAALLADALAALARRWPRQPRDVRGETARRAFVDGAEAAELAGRGELRADVGNGWAVWLDLERRPIECGPGLRCVRVIPSPSASATLALLAAAASPLASVGVACARDTPAPALVAALVSAGASIVCPVGRMQAPPIDRDPQGRRRLADLLAWREVQA